MANQDEEAQDVAFEAELPETAFITDFYMLINHLYFYQRLLFYMCICNYLFHRHILRIVNGERLNGTVVRKAQAQATYEAAKTAGQSAGLAEKLVTVVGRLR